MLKCCVFFELKNGGVHLRYARLALSDMKKITNELMKKTILFRYELSTICINAVCWNIFKTIFSCPPC